MYFKYPFSKWFAPRKDGLYVVKHQGRVHHIGIAFSGYTGKNIKQQVKYHYTNEETEIAWMFNNRDITSINFIPMDNYEKAVVKREALYAHYGERVKHYEA